MRYGRQGSQRNRAPHAAAKGAIPFLRVFGSAVGDRSAVGRLLQQPCLSRCLPTGLIGAPGDLAPLAHISLPLLGLGEVNFEGKDVPSSEVNQRFGWEPITLQSKEGLALLNGTQLMAAYEVAGVS